MPSPQRGAMPVSKKIDHKIKEFERSSRDQQKSSRSRGFVPVIHGASCEALDEADTLDTAGEIASALDRLGFDTEIRALSANLSSLEELAASAPLCVFNLVEALEGNAARSSIIPAELERLKLTFTGAADKAYRNTLAKLPTKKTLRTAGLPTPDWWVPPDAPPHGRKVIVKSVSEHGSVGMDEASVVDAAEALAELGRRKTLFDGDFFAESFVAGREFNIGLLQTVDGPIILPTSEIRFDLLPKGRVPIVDYEAKWIEDSPVYQLTPRRFGLEKAEPFLAARLAGLARACWGLFDLTGYARVDIRLDERGHPFILEINANPCLAGDAGFAASAETAGISYDAMIGMIVEAALLQAEGRA